MPIKLNIARSILRLMQRFRLSAILLTAILTMAALMALARLPLSTEKTPEKTVTSPDGVYDLTQIPDLAHTVVCLPAPDFYYPDIYLTPENADKIMPESVEKYDVLRADYLSQRFMLLLPDDGAVYTLTFRLSGRHAMRVYINGSLSGQTGRPGLSKRDTEVWENNLTCTAAAQDGKMDILLNSAQFYHAKGGASLAQLYLSRSGLGYDPFAADRINGLLVIGVLLGAAALLLSIYLLLSHTVATLYFALACLAMALREVLQSQAWVYFPLSGNLSFMLEYLSVVLLTVFLSLYLGQYATQKWLMHIRYAAIIASAAYGCCILLVDSIFYTAVLGYYQLWLVLCIVSGITGLFWNMRRPTTEQAAALYGIAVFYLAAVSDIVMYSDILGDSPNVPISEMAMLVFALAQTVALLLMNNRVLAEAQEAKQKLAAEKDALETLNRMKTEFLGNVSHEFKTPLTVMSGYAQSTRQLAQRPEALNGGEVSHRMTLIASEAERLSLMVGQILDVTRMEEGRMAMEPVRCYIDEIIYAAVDTHYPILNKNANRLQIRIDNGLPAIYADPARISQVVVNLISNAVRFTLNGLITVSAKRAENQIIVCVADNGKGIAPERLPHLFERYGNKKKSADRTDTGTGLGLYICKHIVTQHGGEIWIKSDEGTGTAAFFTLPVFQADVRNTVSRT